MDDKARQRIMELAEENGGRIEPDQVIAEARKRNSPLHSYFDWDVERAAWENWRNVARDLIRSVHIERVVHEKTVRSVAYIRDPSKHSSEQGYVSVEILRDDKINARHALETEFDRAEAALRRALEVAKALELERDVEGLLRRIGLVRAKAVKGLVA